MALPAWWAWAGGALIAAAMATAAAGVEVAARNLTPLCWTGLIVLVDGVLAARGGSWLRGKPRELLLAALISVPSWLLFELYNRPRFWQSDGPELWWHYSGLPPWPGRALGYVWSFATITPAVLLLAELVEPAVARLVGRGAGGKVPRELSWLLVAAGSVLAAFPLLWPSPYFAADVWLAWPLVLDPINHRRGRASLLGDLEAGRRSRLAALLVAGLACGALWEAWNTLASARWSYTVPFAGVFKAFEMPALGYFGFAPFALAVFALYQFLRGLLPGATASPRARESSSGLDVGSRQETPSHR